MGFVIELAPRRTMQSGGFNIAADSAGSSTRHITSGFRHLLYGWDLASNRRDLAVGFGRAEAFL